MIVSIIGYWPSSTITVLHWDMVNMMWDEEEESNEKKIAEAMFLLLLIIILQDYRCILNVDSHFTAALKHIDDTWYY